MDQYEQKYNFRYEEEGGDQIQTYGRNIESIREKDNKRKGERERREERKKEEKERKVKDNLQLKLAKKKEIMGRIRKIQEVGQGKGNEIELFEFLDKEY